MKNLITFTLFSIFIGGLLISRDSKKQVLYNDNCLKIQHYWKKYKRDSKKQLLCYHHYCFKIQNCWRRYKYRKQVLSCLKIQSFWKAYRSKIQNASSCIIQRAWDNYKKKWFIFEKV